MSSYKLLACSGRLCFCRGGGREENVVNFHRINIRPIVDARRQWKLVTMIWRREDRSDARPHVPEPGYNRIKTIVDSRDGGGATRDVLGLLNNICNFASFRRILTNRQEPTGHGATGLFKGIYEAGPS